MARQGAFKSPSKPLRPAPGMRIGGLTSGSPLDKVGLRSKAASAVAQMGVFASHPGCAA
jgi:hypothetical protein